MAILPNVHSCSFFYHVFMISHSMKYKNVLIINFTLFMTCYYYMTSFPELSQQLWKCFPILVKLHQAERLIKYKASE